jgi:hypothetical protein
MVGMARIMAIEPDLPLRLLSGNPAQHTIKPRRTGIKAIDNMGLLEVSWYTGQLKRIGRGALPQPDESALWVFVKQAFQMAIAGKTKRQPTKLRAN